MIRQGRGGLELTTTPSLGLAASRIAGDLGRAVVKRRIARQQFHNLQRSERSRWGAGRTWVNRARRLDRKLEILLAGLVEYFVRQRRPGFSPQLVGPRQGVAVAANGREHGVVQRYE